MPTSNQDNSQPTKTISLHWSEADMAAAEREAAKLGYDNVADYLLRLHQNQTREYNDSQGSSAKFSDETHTTDLPSPTLRSDFPVKLGSVYQGDSSILMREVLKPESVDLIMTSPPFGLVRKKDYGNEDADRYVAWFEQFADGFKRVLKPNGSLVIDIGGAWKKGLPTRSLYHFELLTTLCRDHDFHLAQEFYWWNPSKLPTPAEWVNVRRVRVKDAVNCIWWLSPTPFPKASNRRVLQPYSDSMKDLLKNGYTPKLRPSGHDISDKFGRDNSGAIPPNLIALANTESNSAYQRYCREHQLPEHPARFPAGIPAFFVRMLTDPGDTVLDPFAGSCVTGEVCERMNRKWICCELDAEYVEGSIGRFENLKDALFVNDLEMSRTKPYAIFPPHSLPVNEQRTPLVHDGGQNRPADLAHRRPNIEE